MSSAEDLIWRYLWTSGGSPVREKVELSSKVEIVFGGLSQGWKVVVALTAHARPRRCPSRPRANLFMTHKEAWSKTNRILRGSSAWNLRFELRQRLI